jgi:hypothetical protein
MEKELPTNFHEVTDHQVATGNQEKNHTDQVDPGTAPGAKPLVDDVHAYMAVVKQGVAGTDEENESEQVPLQLLGKNEAGFEQVPHDHIHKYDKNQQQADPGNHAAHRLVGSVDDAAKNPLTY